MDGIRALPLAFESLGVRSMCTFVETPDVGILIDAGAALGPRQSLLPHPLEYEALSRSRERIREFSRRAQIITVSHYHHDHYTPNFTDFVWLWSSEDESRRIYEGKEVYLKDFRNSINFSQRRRGWLFQGFVEDVAERVEVADGRAFEFGSTRLRFSNPVPHGEEGGRLGWVLMATVEYDAQKLMFASDVQGPSSDSTMEAILSEAPDLLIIGGPPTYLAGYGVGEASIERGLRNLATICGRVPRVVVDHHLLRDEGWEGRLRPALEAAASNGNVVMTANELIGEGRNLLECRRRELYRAMRPSEGFLEWAGLSPEERRLIPPPLP
ncbi:MAG: hypothetical protein QXG32_06840 [Candidatus Bathyarchaeia archaeon]